MSITEQRRSISLTKEDIRQLEYLTNLFGESRTGVMRRALNELYVRVQQREIVSNLKGKATVKIKTDEILNLTRNKD